MKRTARILTFVGMLTIAMGCGKGPKRDVVLVPTVHPTSSDVTKELDTIREVDEENRMFVEMYGESDKSYRRIEFQELRRYDQSGSAVIEMYVVNWSSLDLESLSFVIEAYDSEGAYLGKGDGFISAIDVGEKRNKTFWFTQVDVSEITALEIVNLAAYYERRGQVLDLKRHLVPVVIRD